MMMIIQVMKKVRVMIIDSLNNKIDKILQNNVDTSIVL
jgi:hypothetical protein